MDRASDEQHPACQKLKEVQQAKKDVKCLAFTPDGDWVVIFGKNGFWIQQSEPAGLQKAERVSATGGANQSGGLHPRLRLVDFLGPQRKLVAGGTIRRYGETS